MASQFSAFAGGGLRFTSRKPPAEQIYGAIRDSLGSVFTDDPNATINIETFAQAKALGLAAETLQRAGNEANPHYCTELLPKLEIDWRTNPPPNATIQERRGILASAMAIKEGDSIPSLTTGLQDIIGSGLIAVVQHPISDTWGAGGIYPAPSDLNQVDGNPGKFSPAGDRCRVIELLENVYKPIQSVRYRYVCGDTSPIAKYDKLVIAPGEYGRMETVDVFVASNNSGYPTSEQTLSARFAYTHEPGDICTTAARPFWISYRRFFYIVVSSTVLDSPPLRQRCNSFLERTVGNDSQWAIVGATGSGTAGPFTIGSSPINDTPITQVTWT